MHEIKSRTENHDNALAKRLVAHWHHTFGATTLFDQPFQHFYSDKVWPVDIYQEILRLLPPHAQFYLPVDMSQQDLGTSFYGEVPVLQRPFLGRYKEIKRLPFVPNSGYAFVVNDLPGHRSLHGRELIKPGSGVRNSILIRWSAEETFRKRGREGISTTHQL